MKKILWKYFAAVFIISSLLIISGCGAGAGKTTLRLDDFVVVSADGFETVGTATCYFDTGSFMNEYSGRIMLSDQCDKEISDIVNAGIEMGRSIEQVFVDLYINPRLSRAESLSNGDTIKILWDCDEEKIEKNFNVELVYSEFEYTVSGLGVAEEYDPFEHITVTFEGMSPEGSAKINKDNSSELDDIDFEIDKSSGLKSGETINVTAMVKGGEDSFTRLYGKILSCKVKSYIVDGLDKYATELSEIPAELHDQMDQQLQNAFKSHAASSWVDGYSFEIKPVRNYLLKAKDGFNVSPDNYLYYVYEVKYSYPKDKIKDFVYYWYGYYTDIFVSKDGTGSVDLSKYKVSESARMWGGDYIEGDYLELENGFYVAGYQDLSTLFNKQIVSKTDKYEYEDKTID